jgi:hypothetical protein
MSEGGEPFPDVTGSVFTASFGLKVPEQFVRNYVASVAYDLVVGRNFSVLIGERQFGPYAIVLCLESTNSPSGAFSLVEQYIRESLESQRSPLALDSPGSSPIPIHCSMQPMENIGRILRVYPRTDAYIPTFIVSYDNDCFANPVDAFKALFETLGFEVALHFQCVRVTERLSEEWLEILSQTGDLARLLQESGIRGWLNRLTGLGKKAVSLRLGIVAIELQEISDITHLEALMRVFYSAPAPYLLTSSTQQVLQDPRPSNSAQYSRVVTVAEQIHSRTVEFRSLLLAALVGASGGLLVSLLTR